MRRGKLFWIAAGVAVCSPVLAYDLARLSRVEDPLILGVQGNSAPTACAISDDGDVIGFLSDATNLIAGDLNGLADAFVDTPANLFRISRDAGGGELPMRTDAVAVSSTGQFVAFRVSTPPISSPVNVTGEIQIYRLNRSNGALTLVADFDWPVGSPGYDTLAISNNGRYVAFSSDQSLVAADTDGAYDVYRYDVQTGNTILVSVDQGVNGANGNVFSIAMDGSGDVIAFDSNESDLVANDTNGLTDVFVRGISAAATTRVSVRSNGDQANGLNFLLDVSDDGLHTLFSSQATNLDSNVADTNGKMDVYRHSLGTGNTRRASIQANGDQFTKDATAGALSGNGALVWFVVSPTGDPTTQLWRKNMASNDLFQLTNTGGAVLQQLDVDADGDDACVLASAASTDLATNDRNARDDVYRVQVDANNVASISREGEPNAPIAAAVTKEFSELLGIDHAGTRAVIRSYGPQPDSETFLGLGDTPGPRAYLVDRFGNAVETPCRNAQGDATSGSCSSATLSGDGQYVFFVSDGSNVHPDMPSGPVVFEQLFRRNLQTGSVDLLSRDTNGDPAALGVLGFDPPSASLDGSRVVFLSYASTLIAGDTNGFADVFLWDASSGIRRVSVNTNGTQANANYLGAAEISDDGNFIVFPHSADTLVSGDSNGDIDLFLRNVSANTLVRIAQPGTQTTSGSGLLEFSADGERLLFRSSASEYSDPNNEDLFQWTRSTNQVVPLSSLVSAPGTVIEPVALLPGDAAGYLYTIDANPNQYLVEPIIYRQYLGGTDPIHSAPVSPTPFVFDYEFNPATPLRVSTDQAVFLGYNWSLDGTDNNRAFDVAELYSGFGYAEFNVGSIDVAEDAGSVAFEVIRHNGQAYSAGVRVFGQNGSASNGADFNIDAAGILASWGNGVDGALAKNVAILDDALAEGNESFSLVLGNFGTVLPGVVTTLTVNIIDDDSNDLIFANGFDP
jgi:hypothetical protein